MLLANLWLMPFNENCRLKFNFHLKTQLTIDTLIKLCMYVNHLFILFFPNRVMKEDCLQIYSRTINYLNYPSKLVSSVMESF